MDLVLCSSMSSGISPLAALPVRVGPRRVGQQVGDAAGTPASSPIGSSSGATPAPKTSPQLVEGALERGPLPVELVDEDHAGEAPARRPAARAPRSGPRRPRRRSPRTPRGRRPAGRPHVAHEVGVAGRVDQVDLVAVPLERRQASAAGDSAAARAPRRRSRRPWCRPRPGPGRVVAPARCSRASARVVFPTPPWPTRATLRILSAGYGVHRAPPMLRSSRSRGPRVRRSRPSAPAPLVASRRRAGTLGHHLVASGSAPERTPADVRRPLPDQHRDRASGPSVPTSARPASPPTTSRCSASSWPRRAAVAIGNGALRAGLLLLVLTGVPDVLDGAVAKASGTASPRGAFFDSVCDRVSRRPAARRRGLVPRRRPTRRPHRPAALSPCSPRRC